MLVFETILIGVEGFELLRIKGKEGKETPQAFTPVRLSDRARKSTIKFNKDFTITKKVERCRNSIVYVKIEATK
jgi:hypothetical protein